MVAIFQKKVIVISAIIPIIIPYEFAYKVLFSRIFQRNISANRLALVGWAVFTIRLKFCFPAITRMFLNKIDWYLEH